MSDVSRRRAVSALAAAALAPGFRRAAAQPAPFTIPVIVSLTGPAASLGGDQATALRAFEKVANRTGGIKGQPVRFTIADDQSSPPTAVQLANAALAAKPTVVMGSCLAPATSAMMPFFREGPVLYALTPIVYPEKGSYVFAPSPLISYAEDATFRYLRLKGLTRIAFIRTNDVSGQDNARSIDAALARPENAVIVTTTTQLFNPGDISIAAQVSAVKASNPQVVFASATGAPFGTVLRSLADAGIDLPVFTSATNLSPVLLDRFKAYLPKGDLLAVGASFFKRDRPASDPLRAPIEEFYTALEADGGVKPSASHAFAWDPARLVVFALRALGPGATPGRLRDYIENLHGFAGVLGNYDFRTGDQHGLDDKAQYVLRYDPKAANGPSVVVSEGGGTPLR
jgi:branched-chain amino acid transport system substrate-binding protein